VGFEAVDKIVHEAIAKALHPAAGNAYSNAVANTPGDRASKDPVVVQIRKENTKSFVKWLQYGQDKGLVDGNKFPERVENYECYLSFK
jgi:hypothetical protein